MSHGQEGRVLDRVPRPVAAPAEDLVAPPGAEDDADGEEAPGEQGPAPGLDQPALADPAGDEAAHGEGEGDGEADEAEVEQRRVEGHQDVVLQQRVGPGPSVGMAPVDGAERVGRAEHQPEEERRHHVDRSSVAQPTSGSVDPARGTCTPSTAR